MTLAVAQEANLILGEDSSVEWKRGKQHWMHFPSLHVAHYWGAQEVKNISSTMTAKILAVPESN